MATKVVIENPILRGSRQEGFLQKVATVYLDGGEEFRVMAPSKATGDALEWLKQFEVRQPTDRGDNVIRDERSGSIIQHVEVELERRKLDADIWRLGTNDDGRFYAAQICWRGHVQNANGGDFKRGEHCPQCGEAFIDSCPRCEVAIRGNATMDTAKYKLPYYCHACGNPYPWMDERLRTARELLDHDDKLTEDDRKALWADLKYVMSDPKADLVPAKKKLINFKLEKATDWVREAVLDLLAKTAAEVIKG